MWGAAKLWLTNRKPGRWRGAPRDKRNASLEQQISLMTPAERAARLAQLQAQAVTAVTLLGKLLPGLVDGCTGCGRLTSASEGRRARRCGQASKTNMTMV